MCLPAAYSTVHTWVQGFGLQPMPDEDLDAACKDLRLLIFPGTQVLHKQLLPPLSPKQGPLMTPPWAEEPTGSLTDGQRAARPPSEPQLDAEAVTSPLPVLEAKAEASAAATAVAAPSDMLPPVQKQPDIARMPPSVAAAAGAVDDTPLTEHPSGARSDPEVAGDVAMGEPTTASAQQQAVPEDAPARGVAAASAETAQVSSLPGEGHGTLADARPELASAEAASRENGGSSDAGLHVQSAPAHNHLAQQLGTSVRENDGDNKIQEASAATQDPFVQVTCSWTAVNCMHDIACTCLPQSAWSLACYVSRCNSFLSARESQRIIDYFALEGCPLYAPGAKVSCTPCHAALC